MVYDINLDSLQLSQTKSGSLIEKTSKQSDFVDRKQSKRNGESNLTCQERKKNGIWFLWKENLEDKKNGW